MYLDQLSHEQLMDVRGAMQGWQSAITGLSGLLDHLRLMFAIKRATTPATFHVHRVPGADTLR